MVMGVGVALEGYVYVGKKSRAEVAFVNVDEVVRRFYISHLESLGFRYRRQEDYILLAGASRGAEEADIRNFRRQEVAARGVYASAGCHKVGLHARRRSRPG